MHSILIIEDNTSIAENIALYLTAKGYHTEIAHDGERAFDMIRSGSYDCLIVDRMIPRIDGLTLMRMLIDRRMIIPFLFLTARDKQIDRIEGLALGADDYLVKPFDLEELRLRIENIMRRRWVLLSPTITDIGDISIDIRAKRVTRLGYLVDLSPKEYAILALLLAHRGTVMDRDTIYEVVWWDIPDVFSGVLDTINVHIAHIRKKTNPDIIRTVKLVWYIIDL
jgi:DNA-binding response OmpR family regulator